MHWFNDLLNLDPDWRKRSRPAHSVPMPQKLPAQPGAQIAQPSRRRKPRTASTSKATRRKR